jgi:hypothetical protein
MTRRTDRSFSIDALRRDGFNGFHSVADLAIGREKVPSVPGVYVVARTSTVAPRWRRTSPAGWFKGKDPTVPVEILKARWIDGSTVIYIGKADVLERRIRQYLAFGAGLPVGHWGGRLIWQLADSEKLLIGWAAHAEPIRREAALLDRFVDEYGSLPFANLRR